MLKASDKRPGGDDLNLPREIDGRTAPFEIHNWQSSQLSIAKYYGACTYNGADYVIDQTADGQPLVRKDLFDARVKLARKAKKHALEKASNNQGELEV